jgi:alanine racemase
MVYHAPAGRPLWAEVDLDALAHNLQTLKEKVAGAQIMAVVKANAYGHGAVGVARALVEAGAEALAVVCTEEAQELRQAGVMAPILVMGPTPPEDAPLLVELEVATAVASWEMAQALAQAAAQRGRVHPVHIKVDTGLNRFGLPPREALLLAQALRHVPSLRVEGLFTHFAAAEDGDKDFTLAQFREFMAVARQVPWVPLRHVANTATILDMPELALEMARPGLGLYGCHPPGMERSLPLRPVLSLKARLMRVMELAPGQTVSYGRTWRAHRPSRIGLIPCGYADGLPRALSNRGWVLVRGRRVPIVGRVCMDMTMVDLTTVPEAQVGDEVVIIGRQGDEEVTADEIASLCYTISYEILCGIGPRVPRVFLQAGAVRGVQVLKDRWEEAPTPRQEARR